MPSQSGHTVQTCEECELSSQPEADNNNSTARQITQELASGGHGPPACPSGRDVTDDLRAVGSSGIDSCRPESSDEVVTMRVTGPDGTLIEVPIYCSSPA